MQIEYNFYLEITTEIEKLEGELETHNKKAGENSCF